MNKKAQLAIYMSLIVVIIVIILISAVLAPMGILFSSEMVKAGENILSMSNESIQSISDPTIKASVQNTINSAFEAADDNIEVDGAIFQYAWVFVLIISGLGVFLMARRLQEFGGGFV